jgi:hypothetical protein
MNRKLGHLLKATIIALPLALPAAALAQAAGDSNTPPSGSDTAIPPTNDTTNLGKDHAASPNSVGGTMDNADKQNAGAPGTTPTTPPAGSMDNSGSSTATDRNVGGDINKSSDDLKGDSTSTMTKQKTTKKKTIKNSTGTDVPNDNSTDLNR